jgi:predicted amidophosphoribosyltransferase
MKENSHSERACPFCGATYELGARHCSSCGADLVRECPACGALNALDSGRCLACGQELEILDSLFARVTGRRAEWLRQLREEAPAIKVQQEEASQARLAGMWADETRRREELARARAERDRQQRIIVGVAVGIVAIIVIAILVTLMITMSRTPGPYSYLY